MRTTGFELKSHARQENCTGTKQSDVKEREKTEMQQRKSEGVNPEEELKRLTRFLYC